MKAKSVAELLSGPERWCKMRYSLNKEEKSVEVTSEEAVRWCLVGAVTAVYPSIVQQEEILQRIRDKVGSSVCSFNDAQSTTFETIRALVEELGI